MVILCQTDEQVVCQTGYETRAKWAIRWCDNKKPTRQQQDMPQIKCCRKKASVIRPLSLELDRLFSCLNKLSRSGPIMGSVLEYAM